MSPCAKRARVVCLTPVKNEAWILQQFLTAASLWADDIIIADQGSTDDSVAIAKRFPRVTLVANNSDTYNESRRQQLLITAARKLPGPKILVALDADEFLSPLLATPNSIPKLMDSRPGSFIRVPWMNVNPNLQNGWIGHRNFIAAWFDNNREHESAPIHATRVPVRSGDLEVKTSGDALVLHWQYTAVERMRSKHRWYLAWERVHNIGQHPIRLYRQYHHMNAVPRSEMVSIHQRWIDWYQAHGIHLKSIRDDGFHWWDHQVLAWMNQLGVKHFAREAIWDKDWEEVARASGVRTPERFADPRNAWQRLVHLWLQRTQRYHRRLIVRGIDKILRGQQDEK